MRRLVWEVGFRRALKQTIRHDPTMQGRILSVLKLLEADPFQPQLRTHKLRGQLEGLWACWVAYDCRIIFTFEPDPPGEDLVLLIDIGSHEEVY